MKMGKPPEGVTMLTAHLFKEPGYHITDWDLDRVFVEDAEGTNFIIRMWDITEEDVRWSLFQANPEGATEIGFGYYDYATALKRS